MKKSLSKIFGVLFLCFCNNHISVAQDITTGLVAHYEFENSTGAVLDAAGSHDGTISGGVTRDVQGKIGRAFSFSGSGYVNVTDHSDITNYSEFTLSAWIYPTFLGTYNTVVSKVSPNRDFNLKINSGTTEQVHFAHSATYYSCSGTSTILTNDWIHVLCTWQNNEWKVYYNGVLEKTNSYPGKEPLWTGTLMQIGAMSNGERFYGTIDDVRVYNRALTATDVTALYNYTGDIPVISINDTTIFEDSGQATFTISLDTISSNIITGDYITIDGSALDISDYTAQNSTFTINAGELSTTVSVPVIDDTDEETDEFFKLALSNPLNATLAIDTGICTILTNDLASLSVNDTTVSENDGQATFTISLDKTSFQTVTGNYATIDGSATSTTDYTAQNSTFTINPGEISTTVSVPVTNDADEEIEEIFKLAISNLLNATLATDTGICTILTNDLAALSINDTTVLEDEGQVAFTISIDKVSFQTISGTYTTSDGTAQDGSDYTATSNSFTINAGDTSTTVSVPILDDLIEDSNENFTVDLSNPTAAIISDTSGVCTILDMNCLPGTDCPVTSVNNETGIVQLELFVNGNDLSITGGDTVSLPLGGSTLWELNGTDIVQIGSGNVGIGTTNPDEKLTVKGNIHAEEVIVDLGVPGPDYVFEKDYDLRTVSELEKFLNKRKHLPEVPSATEMEDKGINLSEMNMLLLKRIEELTLYIIDQEKRINSLENNTNPKTK